MCLKYNYNQLGWNELPVIKEREVLAIVFWGEWVPCLFLTFNSVGIWDYVCLMVSGTNEILLLFSVLISSVTCCSCQRAANSDSCFRVCLLTESIFDFFFCAITSKNGWRGWNKKGRGRKRAAEWVCDMEPVYSGWLESGEPVMHYKKLVMSFVLGASDDKFKDHRSIKPL